VILDSSAIVAIRLREHGWEDLVAKLASEPTGVGAPTLAETSERAIPTLTRDLAKRETLVVIRAKSSPGLPRRFQTSARRHREQDARHRARPRA